MPLSCTRCGGTGFLNGEYLPDEMDNEEPAAVLAWINAHPETEVCVCDCCGNGEDRWHGTPGEHYGSDDPPGPGGPYAYNGGLCECH
jgi:hypothetical protein